MNLKFNDNIFRKFPFLESERLIFRQFGKNDKEQLFRIRSDNQVMHYMDTLPLKDIAAAKGLINYFKWEFKNKNGITWAIVHKQENLLIGSFAFWHLAKPHCRAEIGYSLLPEYWGKGLMTETFKTLIEYGFNLVQLHSINANVNPQNANSIKLLERIGFKKEAHFRENYLFNNQFLDSVIYCLIESDKRNY